MTTDLGKVLWWRYLILVAVLLIMCPIVANADKQYPTTIIAATQSPVTLTKCDAWARDWNKTVLTAHAAISNALFDLGIAFTNNSSKPVTEIRVKLVSYDSFNNVIGSSDVDTQMNQSAKGLSVAPAASFELLGPQSWHGKNAHPDRDHVSCEVTAVRFADGSIWSIPIAAAQPSSQPIAKTYSDGAMVTLFGECYTADVCAKISFPDGRSIVITSGGYSGGHSNPLDAHLTITTLSAGTVINSTTETMNIAGNQSMGFDHGMIHIRFNLRREADYIEPEIAD